LPDRLSSESAPPARDAARSSLRSTATLIGTFWRFSLRRWAVTVMTLGSLAPSVVSAACAWAGASAISPARARARREITPL